MTLIVGYVLRTYPNKWHGMQCLPYTA